MINFYLGFNGRYSSHTSFKYNTVFSSFFLVGNVLFLFIFHLSFHSIHKNIFFPLTSEVFEEKDIGFLIFFNGKFC